MIHEQTDPATEWIIGHPYGPEVILYVEDTSGRPLHGLDGPSVHRTDVALTLTFPEPTAGRAIVLADTDD